MNNTAATTGRPGHNDFNDTTAATGHPGHNGLNDQNGYYDQNGHNVNNGHNDHRGRTAKTGTTGNTGLLTRFVPNKLKTSRFYGWFLRLTRVLQFLSAIISLGIFSSRVYKVYRLVNNIKTRRGISHSYGAVEGILAAAVLYTLIATLLGCLKRNSSPGTKKGLRWAWVVLDLAFVGAFIAVAVLTRPNGGSAGPRHCYSGTLASNAKNANGNQASGDKTCQLPWATFILAIISTLLHAITASFHEVRDHHKRNKHDRAFAEQDKAFQQNGRYEYGDHRSRGQRV